MPSRPAPGGSYDLGVNAFAELEAGVRAGLAAAGVTGTCIVGCSGGVDSTALALLVPDPSRVVLAHVDHGVHPEHTRAARFVADLAQRLTARFTLRELNLRPGETSEAAMRARRYEALLGIAREHGAAHVLTAHHADDDLETLLLRLERGTGLRGLCGIPARRPLATGVTVVRPLLETRKRTLEAYVAAAGVTPVVDPTNSELDKRRNHVRHVLLPELRARHGSGFDANLFALLRTARATVSTITEHTARHLETHFCASGGGRGLLRLAVPALARPLCLDLFLEVHQRLAGERPSSRWCERVLALAFGGATGGQVSGGSPVLAERTREGIAFVDLRKLGAAPSAPIDLTLDAEPVRFGTTPWSVTLSSLRGARGEGRLLDSSSAPWPWRIRASQPGDRIVAEGHLHAEEVSRLASRRGIPRFERGLLPLLVDRDDRILAVADHVIATAVAAKSTTTEAVALVVTPQ